jgi:hypothetical protein
MTINRHGMNAEENVQHGKNFTGSIPNIYVVPSAFDF